MSTQAGKESQVPDEYIIWPRKHGMTPEEITKTEDSIRLVTGIEEPIKSYTSSFEGLMFWIVPSLKEVRIAELEKLDMVATVQLDCEEPDDH